MAGTELDAWAVHLGVTTDDDAVRVLTAVANRLDDVASDLVAASGVVKDGPDDTMSRDLESAWGRVLATVDTVHLLRAKFARHERGVR